MQIEITDENFLEAKEKLEKQEIEILKSIARRFNMKDYEKDERSVLIHKIVQKIKMVMIEKYEPKSHEKLKQITDLLVQNLISTPGNKIKKSNTKKSKTNYFYFKFIFLYFILKIFFKKKLI